MSDQIRFWLLPWLALIAAPAVAGDASWTWADRGNGSRAITIDLVRGDVSVERSPAEARIAIDGSSDAAQVEAVEQPGTVRITDRYPARSTVASTAECLPPADARGDYWSYPARFAVRVRLRPGQPLRIRLKQGDIWLPTTLDGIDAETADGRVLREPSAGIANR